MSIWCFVISVGISFRFPWLHANISLYSWNNLRAAFFTYSDASSLTLICFWSSKVPKFPSYIFFLRFQDQPVISCPQSLVCMGCLFMCVVLSISLVNFSKTLNFSLLMMVAKSISASGIRLGSTSYTKASRLFVRPLDKSFPLNCLRADVLPWVTQLWTWIRVWLWCCWMVISLLN